MNYPITRKLLQYLKNIWENEDDKYKWKTIDRTLYKWEKKSQKDFFNNLNNCKKEIEEISQHIEAGLIHSTGEKIQQLFINTAKKTLTAKQKKASRNWKKRKKSEKWFDHDCLKLKNEVRLAGKQKLIEPFDTLLRQNYHKKLKLYKRTCKSKKYFFVQNSLNEINSCLDNSELFWNKWKTFGDINPKRKDIEIGGQKIYDHFSTLYKTNIEDDEISPEPTQKKILDNEKLNEPLSKKEFYTVIDNLKKNKAEDYKGISNQ